MGEEFEEKRENIEELKKVFSTIVNFVKEVKTPLIDLIKSIMTVVSGSDLGEDVATFYKKLKESGMPQEVAVNLTSNYLSARLSILKEFGSIISNLASKKKWSPEEIEELIKEAKEK
ncbi:MAG: hypothetical protein NDF55_00375 [archaeon GB-1867-005]|nr:hypothetical protein [Candidatus Culexmicrobium cathedralense]